MDPWLEGFGALALLCLATGGLVTLIALVAIRRRLPPEARFDGDLEEGLVASAFQPQAPPSDRRAYILGLLLMTAAPYIGLVGALAASRRDLAWPFVVLCAIGSFATFVTLRRGAQRQGPVL